MTARDLIAWRGRHGYDNIKDAADALGTAWRSLYYYERGRTIPRVVKLLCDAYDQGFKPKA